MKRKIVIVGYGGHGKSIADSIETKKEYDIIGYTDRHETENSKYNYLGTDEMLESIYNEGVRYAILGVGYMGKGTLRDILYKKLIQIGYSIPAIIDTTSIVSPLASVGEGTYVGKGAIINAYASVGKNCIINSGAIVEHSCIIGNYSHVAVGAVLCGDACIGEHTFVGANATIINGMMIGENVVVAAGTTVIRNISSNQKYYGI